MDDDVFHSHVAACQSVPEDTSCLEIFNYSDPVYNSIDEHQLPPYQIDNFLQEKGNFTPSAARYGVKLVGGICLILQQDAKHAETFAPQVISMKAEQYESMVRILRLPYRAIEGTSVVGPFFWSSYSHGSDDPRLHIIFRKSDTRRLGKTEGFEIVLSYAFKTGVTTGFVKGTPSSHISESIDSLKRCGAQVHHPLLLPLIMLSHDLGSRRDQQLRDTRDWVRKLERSISQRMEIENENVKESMADIEDTNRALVECHAQVLRKRPQDWLEIIKGMEDAMTRFRSEVPPQQWTSEVDGLHASISGRLDFYKIKLKAIQGYAHTTMERLNIQRNALSSIIAHRESIVNLQMVAMITDQRRIAQASKKDANAMKRLSMLGAIFLPGTFISSIFSMVFFNFQAGASDDGGEVHVAPQLWIYFAMVVPLTLIVVVAVWLLDRRHKKKSKGRTAVLEEGLEVMEREIAAQLRRQTTGKMVTFVEKEEE